MALLTQNGQVLRRRTAPPIALSRVRELIRPLDEVEQKAIKSALILCEGHRGEAASRLGIDPHTLRKKIHKYRAAGEQWTETPKAKGAAA